MTEIESAQLAALDGGRPALVVIDVQHSFADPELLEGWGLDASALEAVGAAVRTTADLVAAARASRVPVVWVELATDPARPWRASLWLRIGDPDAPLPADEPCVVGTPGAQWYGMAPAEGELRVRKRGYSGFRDTRLDPWLRDLGVDHLIVAGLTTECCVAATVFDAVQSEWPVLLVTDATAAYSAALHESALAQLALNAAVLVDAATVTERIRRALPAAGALA